MATVLIVEDDPINVRVFSTILRKRGNFEVICSEDVTEIITLVATGKVDVVMMDVSLTASMYQGELVDGIRITQILRANPETQDIPIILVTAHAMQGDRETFLAKSGADGYISKPVVDYDDFLGQIRRLLKA
ncbi:receiver domain response regulatory protein [[Synechococcus] sp. NIES-970]|uniref:response regulator n=1 Tax=Picosynechococcus sp. NKBG15041c TaxID=1407650 RepID=UPI000410C412|nr:response regulator [Picosynechococcus sp. NKBG15041c]BAW97284.1 receiver domain response regulatory protein [[Synechococcus] sp. NIES-970]